MPRPIAYIENDDRTWRCDGCGSYGGAMGRDEESYRAVAEAVAAHIDECTPQGTSRQLSVYKAEELREAQNLVYARHADVAQARADLAREEAALSDAMTLLNKVIDSLL
ncbi:hypothetical protein GCM10023347_33910 [Streptomyces chumphonensis]|uniref:Uncharacterized protein n=1 Tax=Streptomyces chumphonensis TaxID=1214925 RepID=A0A927EYB2_9ACTN|nr:hypothetical protein [Streptomyces chumphonensis]MBD3931938.1 hypothetical protein [Streptomyces chumphonensis]